MPRRVRFTEAEARAAIAASLTWTEALRRLGYLSNGGNPQTLKKYAGLWQISTAHFDPNAARRAALKGERVPLDEVLVENSTFSRGHLKRRLFNEGLKLRSCEFCGQGESWRGGRMALVLDHANGVPNDHRLANLRILCPNCAATLDTHCGRKNANRTPKEPRSCLRCGRTFFLNRSVQKYCSSACGTRHKNRERWRPRPGRRKVERPPYEQLLKEIRETSYLAVGRKYGVSDHAIRKWVVWYEREAARLAAEESEGREAAEKVAT